MLGGAGTSATVTAVVLPGAGGWREAGAALVAPSRGGKAGAFSGFVETRLTQPAALPWKGYPWSPSWASVTSIHFKTFSRSPSSDPVPLAGPPCPTPPTAIRHHRPYGFSTFSDTGHVCVAFGDHDWLLSHGAVPARPVHFRLSGFPCRCAHSPRTTSTGGQGLLPPHRPACQESPTGARAACPPWKGLSKSLKSQKAAERWGDVLRQSLLLRVPQGASHPPGSGVGGQRLPPRQGWLGFLPPPCASLLLQAAPQVLPPLKGHSALTLRSPCCSGLLAGLICVLFPPPSGASS